MNSPVSHTQQPRPRFVGLQFLALALAWGSSFLLIKVALEGINPAQVMVGRLLLGAGFLILVMLITRRRWPRGARTWGALVVISIFLAVLPFTLYAWARQYIHSGQSSIYNATTPIATLLFALLLLPEEKLTRGRAIGLLIGAAGVIIIAAPWNIAVDGGSASELLLAQLACLGANSCYAISYVLSRRLLRGGRHDPTAIAASQIVLSAGIGVVLAPFIGGFEVMHLTTEVVASMILLGVIGTGFAYIWVNKIIVAWGPTPASTVTYLTPVVGVVLGILVLGEVLHWNEPVGGLIILLGVLFSQGRLRWRRA